MIKIPCGYEGCSKHFPSERNREEHIYHKHALKQAKLLTNLPQEERERIRLESWRKYYEADHTPKTVFNPDHWLELNPEWSPRQDRD